MKAFVLCLFSVLLGTAMAWGQQADEQRGRTEFDDGAEVLTRGPMHEAFAGPVAFDPEPGMAAPKAPPEAIEELPPQHRPEGANVEWIPGYWAWDDDTSDFLWVSGIWRNLPPGRQWVPGYWSRSTEGAQWTSGYWADAEAGEMDYLPEPPESVESGPNVEAPSAEHTWLPGCWVWQQNRYAWRPGFWTPSYENWVWTPAHYQWTARGYVFVDGYWDHAVSRRGLLFAPVRFDQSVYSQRGFSYTPSTVIRIGELVSHLFLRPNYGHYYYGDYYGTNYASAGFYPSYSFHSSRRGYDPIYSHQRWQHRQDSGWEGRVQEHFQYRRDHDGARPPRTFSAQQELLNSRRTERDQGQVLAQSLDEFRARQESPLPFQSLNDEDRRGFGRRGQEVRIFGEQRQKLETQSLEPTAEQPAGAREPTRLKFPRSPLVGKVGDELGKNVAPPKTHKIPDPDPKVVPKPRPERRTSGEIQNRKATKPRQERRTPGEIRNPKATKPQTKQHSPPDVRPGKRPAKANDKPERKPQGKSAGKPTDLPTKPPEGPNENA